MAHNQRSTDAAPAVLVTDPVCGMSIDPDSAAGTVEHEGRTYVFCSDSCRSRFVEDPRRFTAVDDGGDVDEQHVAHDHHAGHGSPAAGGAPPVAGAGQVVEYTCPMHPEIRRPGPGACPICGMALEPVTVTADTGPSPELKDMTRRFWGGVALSVPVVLLEMVGHFVPAIREAVGGERATTHASLRHRAA